MTANAEKMPWTYWLHLAIGLGFMLVFPMLSPIEPITEVGMAVLGVFIGMVYLWSTLDSIWPSLMGLCWLPGRLCAGAAGICCSKKIIHGIIRY